MKDLQPNEAAWLAARKLGIGGSDAASVLGEKYGCPRALFYDKSGVEPDYQYSEASLDLFQRGHALEPLVVDRFVVETGYKVAKMPARVSKDKPWMRVNVDRMIYSIDERGPGYLEAKTANEHVFSDMLAHGFPAHYVIQAQHGLAVTGWQWGHFAVLEPYTFRFVHFEFKREEALIEVLNVEEEKFWKAVQAGDIPDKLADFNDERCSKCVYRRGCRNAEALPKIAKKKKVYEPDTSPEIDILVGNIKHLDAQAKDAQSQKEIERQKLEILLGEREAVFVPGQGTKLAFGWSNGSLTWDGAALDAEQPHLAYKYKRRSAPRRTIRMFDANEAE